MKKQVGVWVDHRKAVIVTIGQNEEAVHVVHSAIETRDSSAGESRSRSQHGQQDIVGDNSLQNQSSVYLKKYYNDIVSYISNADYIILMGPGEAKIELRNSIEGRSMGHKILEVRPADKMTDREITLEVRAYFAKL